MIRSEAISKLKGKISPLILYGYKANDTSFTVNDGDPDLKPITLTLPEPPDWNLIDGWGVEAKDQKFKKAVYPARLRELEDKITDGIKESRTTAKNEVVTVQRIIDELWKQLDIKQSEYRDEIKWIERQWYFVLNGYWCFINGKPTFIDGFHYFFLNFWDLTDAKTEYRDRDRRFFHFQRYALTSTEDSKGRDTGHRTIFGTTYPKHRRDGATHKFLSMGYVTIINTIGSLIFGIQSFDDDNAREHYTGKLLPAFKAMPFFFKPIWKGSQAPQSELSFSRVDNNVGQELGSKVNFATSAAKKFYDGKKLIYVQLEEEGKCLGFGETVRMADGSIKEVQEIVVGDKIAGDDMTDRTVLSTTKGRDQLFRIIPNKGKSWVCNGPHIITVKHMGSSFNGGVGRGDILDISVNDFLRRGGNKNKNFNMFKVGVEFKEQNHNMEPYFLGVWLGDGNCADVGISGIDKEVIGYIEEYSKSRGLNIRSFNGMTHYISGNTNVMVLEIKSGGSVKFHESIIKAASAIESTAAKIRWACNHNTRVNGSRFQFIGNTENTVTTALRELGLLKNKHIPDEFLFDSRKNRLELLAGIIDTDGYLCTGERKVTFEITQKNKTLSSDIIKLCEGLGIRATICEKIARMKREDGSVYECLVYRMRLYGNNLYQIPCKIERKKAKFIENKRGRNPMHTGFRIEPIGEGDYYGFTIDGNGRFLLGDYTVTHNTKAENIFERWKVVKQCLAQGSGSSIHGFAAHPTTVADMDEDGGRNFYKLNEDSKFFERNPRNGQTRSGLIRLFIPATDGLENFIGPYGESVIDTPTPEQAAYINRDIGAKEFIHSQLEEYVRIGTPDAMKSYRDLKRLFPLEYADCFRTAEGDTGFDIEKLDIAIERLRRESLDEINPPTVRGDFRYIIPGEPNPVSSKEFLERELYRTNVSPRVEWFPNPDGIWELSERLEAGRSNLKYMMDGEYFPQYPFRYTSGADPFQFLDKGNAQKREDSSRLSKGGGTVFKERDTEIDPDHKPINEWQTHRFVATYENRPETDDEYAEDMLMGCLYFGAEEYCEQNIKLVWKHFVKRHHSGYLKYKVDETTGKPREFPGFYSLQNSKQELFGAIKTYIKWHIQREKHLCLVEQFRSIRGVEYMTDFDLLTAGGAALLGSQIVRYEVDASEEKEGTEVGSVMPQFEYS